MLTLLLLLHGVLALASLPAARWLGRRVFFFSAVAPLATTAVLWRAPQVVRGHVFTESVSWIPGLQLELGLRLDALALLTVGVLSTVGVIVFVFCVAYFRGEHDHGRFAATFLFFTGAMLGLLLADNVLALYVFWELTTITSYLLIGFSHDLPDARPAARQALLVTTLGGLAMLAGFVILGQAGGTFALSELVSDPPRGTAASVGLVLVLLGAFAKSAQVPFHGWLPAAMVAPTPVSAYLHSATMVTAGVYLVARLAPGFAAAGAWRPTVVTVGLASLLAGAAWSLRQFDLKRLLAYSTISELGLMIALVGIGTPAATKAGLTLLLAHALFKAAMFMVAGGLDRQAGTRDLRELRGIRRKAPLLALVAALAAASSAGIPPLLGFIAHDEALRAFAARPILQGALVVGAALTVAYSVRFIAGAFGGKGETSLRPLGALFVAPPAVLAGAGLTLGVAPGLVTPVVAAATEGVHAAAVEPLHLWSGFTMSVGLSLAAIAAGFTAAHPRVQRLVERSPRITNADRGYDASISAVTALSAGVTRAMQARSLPVLLGVALVTVVALPTAALLPTAVPRVEPATFNALQLAAGVAVIAAAVATASARARFAAVLALAATGYGVAILFLASGAHDLALTQVLVETLSIVLFVFVLRHLPFDFRAEPQRLATVTRVTVASLFGVFVAAIALVAGTSRDRLSPAAVAYLEQSQSAVGSRNVVTAILTDFRSFDTLGEITVLSVASLGIVTLWSAGRGRQSSSDTENDDR